MRTERVTLVPILVAFVLLCGCAVPKSTPYPREVTYSEFGAPVELETTGGPLAGELIAVEKGYIYVQPVGTERIVQVDRRTITAFTGYRYRSSWGAFLTWGLGGTAGSGAHGWFLVFTAPYWVFTAIAAPIKVWNRSLLEHPDSGWARYPQGLPEHLRRELVGR